ncbi:MAG: histidine phosphatase family protein, partial [Chloroflexi bacterium]|nr:histidine phosphatase family protein [Chloroflexota bacterium]
MSRLILVRHAETEWNQQRRIQGGGSNIPLNEKGLAQAQDIAN